MTTIKCEKSGKSTLKSIRNRTSVDSGMINLDLEPLHLNCRGII